jgi:hypothetical protein
MAKQKKTPRHKRRKKSRNYRLSLYGQPRWDLHQPHSEPEQNFRVQPDHVQHRVCSRVRHNHVSYFMSFSDFMAVEERHREIFIQHPYFSCAESTPIYADPQPNSQYVSATLERINTNPI